MAHGTPTRAAGDLGWPADLCRRFAWALALLVAMPVAAAEAAEPPADGVDVVEDVDGVDVVEDVDGVDVVEDVDGVDVVDVEEVADATEHAESPPPAKPPRAAPGPSETVSVASDVGAERGADAGMEETAADAAAPRSAMSAFADHVTPSGFVQVDYLHLQRSEDQLSDGSGEPLNENAFLLRNARLGARAEWKYVGATTFIEFFSSGGPVRPVTVDVHAQLPRKDGGAPWLKFSAGLLRVPFGFENHDETDVRRFFGERTLVSNAITPGIFDAGASLSGQVWALRWIVGVFNGQPVGAPGYGFRDPNSAKDVVGRLHLRGELFRHLDAAIGFSGMRGKGFSAGTPPTKDSFDWVDLNEDGRVTIPELIPVPGSAGRESESFGRWGVGVDAQLRAQMPHLGELMVYGEFALAHNLDRAVAVADPVLLGRDQRGLGWYVGATQQLTRFAGMGLRFDEYRPHIDDLEPYEGTVVLTRRRFRTLTPAIAGYLHATKTVRARLLLEWEHQLENDLGRDSAGRPARLDNDTLRVRAEMAF